MAIQYKPGKMGKITAPLNDKNEIGIDGKPYPIAPARLSGIHGADPKIGDDCEYKIAYQGPDKGAIIFFAIHRPTLEEAIFSEKAIPAPLKPIDEGLQHNFNDPPEKTSPRSVVGIYVDRSSTQVTIKEADGVNHVYPCDLDLLQYLAKKDIPVKKGETYSWELVQSENKWIAKKVGPAPEEFTGFKTGKDILKENLDAMKSTTVPPAATVPKVPVKEETTDEFNECMALKAQEKRAQEKAAAEVKTKQEAEGDKRMAENAAYAATLAAQKPIIEAAKAVVPAREEPTIVEMTQCKTVGNITQISPNHREYTSDEMLLLRHVIAKDCAEPEFKTMMYMAFQYGLDPLLKQIWAVKRNEKSPAVIIVGRDGMLAIAHRHGQFDGMRSWVEYAEGDKERKGKPLIGHCEIWRKDMSHSFKTEVLFSEYEQAVPSSGYKGLWQTKPSVMLIKVAESVCLRKAFPISGMYAPEEMEQS
jgi:phage recombination protein Bet